MTVTNGAVVIPVQGGRERVTGQVGGNGQIEQLGFSNTLFLAQGSGRIADGAFEINLTTRNMYAPGAAGCEFRYTGRRAG
jgi:hypothetical protein